MPTRPGSGSWQSTVSGTSPKLAGAMEVAIAGAAEVSRVGRRLLHRIWDPEPINDRATNDPVWCLGCSYTLDTKTYGAPRLSTSTPPDDTHDATETTDEPKPPVPDTKTILKPDIPPESVTSSFDSSLAYEEPGQDGGWPPAFLDDFESRIWMTYRTGFEIIPRSEDPKAASALSFTMRLKTSFGDQLGGFSSDTGWGCMIRSGQSLLANALLITRLGREWRRSTDPGAEGEVLSLFADDARAPYSLHNFVRHGAVACGKYPGEWFGPSATSRCIQALASDHENSLRVYSTGDLPDVYEDSFMAVANPDGQVFQPTLILVCTRLGIDKINQVYHEALIATLQMPQSIGIAGGRPSSSHYFVGAQGQWLFYLDPHHPRPALPYHLNPQDYTTEELDSCHTRRLRHLHVEDMDPSMLIGFLIKDEDDWDMWKSSVKHVQGKAIINVSLHDPALGMGSTRAEAIDEVETLSDDDNDADTVLDA
ncbi:putative cysteine protease [Podospora aff. communis PSN243]|uniref:Cysteine protease n=1 Tax=Podospora aff. communis PSN243 TaxID=3040156 RepID=A0AAV9GW29_9PEZI|nr:putative cysteine protease [Podospora aff. communis PSN243]